MRIPSRGIDPITGEPDRRGIPQIACPARQGDVNPQFTCRDCPGAAAVETHQAIDDRGDPFYIVDAVECVFDSAPRRLAALWQRFPNLLAGIVPGAQPRLEPGVACALLSWPNRSAPVSVDIADATWVPTGNCPSCQFYRVIEGERMSGSPGEAAGIVVICVAPPCVAEISR